MLKTYRVSEGRFCDGSGADCNVQLYLNPDEAEKKHLVNELKIDEHTLASAIDPDELSRMEFEPDHAGHDRRTGRATTRPPTSTCSRSPRWASSCSATGS